MKIKWNWGTKLALWISIFILFILTLVFMSLNYDVGLVEKDYYPKGLEYQKRINAIENARQLNADFKVEQDNESVTIQLPNIIVDEGNITFFRPSDTSYDRVYKLVTSNSSKITIPKNDFIQGKYILKFEWQHDNKEYFKEQILFIK